MTNPTPDRPLVTFALFAYNQEQYIREAVEGAFSQTYSPLEIILSDDCSSDRTFEIMQEMAAAYDGPHEVRVRRNTENMNVAPHVLKVLREAKGDYFVLAAGDDFSHPSRTEKIIRCFQKTAATAVHSGCCLIDEFGKIVEETYVAKGGAHVRAWFQVEQTSFVHGATSAYSKAVLKYVPKKTYHVHGEDGLLTTAILANGQSVVFLEDRLVNYRTHASALSNSTSTKKNYKSILSHEKKLSRAVDSYLELCGFALETLERSESKSVDKVAVASRIEKSRMSFALRQHAYSPALSTRIRAFFECDSTDDIKFSLSRLFGLRFFAFIKSITGIRGKASTDS